MCKSHVIILDDHISFRLKKNMLWNTSHFVFISVMEYVKNLFKNNYWIPPSNENCFFNALQMIPVPEKYCFVYSKKSCTYL